MHGIDSFGKKTLWRFQNCKDFHCECHRTKSTGKTKMFEWPGNQQDFWRHVFHDRLIWLWMRQEWTDTSYRFPQVSAALWRICRHIIGRLAIRDYIYQVSARCPLLKLLRNLQAARIHPCDWDREENSRNDISWRDMWKTHWGLILNNVYHVSVDIMELMWKKVCRFDEWIFVLFW